MPLCSLSITYACPYHNPAMRHSIPQRQQTAHPHDAIHNVCHLPCTVKTGIHPWREHLSKVPDVIECEHLPTQVGSKTNFSQVETPMRTTMSFMQMSFPETVSGSLCRNSLVMQTDCCSSCPGVCLRRSLRWRCWMWRSWAGVVTRGLRLWSRLDVLPNSLQCLWRRLMVEKLTFNSRATALVDIPAVSMTIGCSLKTCDIFGIVLCDKLHLLEWSFIVASLRHTCAIIMLSNQHLDMPHLWGGWIISAKEKCSLTQI